MVINEEQALDLLRKMVCIPSFSGDETSLALFLTEKLRAWHFHTTIDVAGNLIAETGAPCAPTVVLMGHMDTVGSFLPVHERNGTLYGRGTVDAKGPLAAFICAAALSQNLPLRLVVIGAVEEEAGSAGAIALRDKYQPDVLFIGEPSGADGIVIGYKGQIKGRFTASAAAGHSAGPTENALVRTVAFWNMLSEKCKSLSAGKSVFDSVVANLSNIQGTAEHSQLAFDIRLPMGFDISTLIKETSYWQGMGSLHFFDHAPPVVHSKDSPPARALRSAIRGAGLGPRIKVKSGTSDMNTVAGYWNAPSVAYGPGDSKLDHTHNEHIALDEYWSSISILTAALAQLAAELQIVDAKPSS